MKITRRRALSLATTAAFPFLLGSSGYPDPDNKRKAGKFKEFTNESKRSIARANRWMLKAINQDGGTGSDIASQTEIACTSVVGIFFFC